MPRPFDRRQASLPRGENIRDGDPDGVAQEFASVLASIDVQLAQIGEWLAQLTARGGNLDSTAGPGGGHVLAIRRPDGTCDVCESEVVAGLAGLHLALSASLQEAAAFLGDGRSEVETRAVLCDLAEHHKQDAAMLRALLREDKRQ